MKNFRANKLRDSGQSLDSRMLSYAARVVFIGALLGLVILIGMQSCRQDKQLSGTFVNSAGSEYSLANDTLVVELIEGNQYRIHRMTGYRLIGEDGRLGRMQRESEEWTAEYDPEHGVMTEKRHGKPIAFSRDGSVMTVGRRAYQRIN